MSDAERPPTGDVWYDISPPLRPGMPAWPGDTEFSMERIARMANGDSVNLSAIHMSAHAGAHVDAPFHLADGGTSVDALSLGTFAGPATVLHRVGAKIIRAKDLDGLDPGVERLLIRTRTVSHAGRFDTDFASLDPEAAKLLATRSLRLIGIDSHSVDAFESRNLECHRFLLSAGIAILEGIDLALVPEGEYEIFAFPLRIAGGDGSPVRAVLRARARV